MYIIICDNGSYEENSKLNVIGVNTIDVAEELVKCFNKAVARYVYYIKDLQNFNEEYLIKNPKPNSIIFKAGAALTPSMPGFVHSIPVDKNDPLFLKLESSFSNYKKDIEKFEKEYSDICLLAKKRYEDWNVDFIKAGKKFEKENLNVQEYFPKWFEPLLGKYEKYISMCGEFYYEELFTLEM
jgi:hypothetical protein